MTDEHRDPPADLSPLLDQLEAQAKQLPDEHRTAALGLVSQLRTEFASRQPHGPSVRAHVSSLSAFVSLVPLVEALASRLANTGL